MEGFEEPLIHNSVSYGIKETIAVLGRDESTPMLDVDGNCLQSNGVLSVEKTINVESDPKVSADPGSLGNTRETSEISEVESQNQEQIVESVDAVEEVNESVSNSATDCYQEVKDISTLTNEINETLIESEKVLSAVKEVQMEPPVADDTIVPSSENVSFETEVVVEQNELTESNESIDKTVDNDSTNNLLNDLGSNLELSDVLRSDASEPTENNNSSVKEEVFNKEELLDILQGNDVELSGQTVLSQTVLADNGQSEIDMALEQLKNLKESPVKTRMRNLERELLDKKLLRKTKVNKKSLDNNSENIKEKKADKKQKTANSNQNPKKVEKRSSLGKDSNQDAKKVKKNDSLASVLDTVIKDWEDEEIVKDEQEKTKSSSFEVPIVESITDQDNNVQETSVANDSTTSNQASEDSQPQRRLSRIIKKKVIFDPDNPDTFTKGKALTKKKDTVEKSPTESDKLKVKDEPLERSPSKSPNSKMMWKKPTPTPKNSKQHKRLSEVDKLLMDEGAVNMIYQLTPEAPKGRKNMRTKAEFIKKLQSSTPDGSEMKFRERKKEAAKDEAEAKKIVSGKQRPSMSSSVKSAACEDFETHSADDSIIYRRHSSSSYSSNCMSPRRLSDVELAANLNTKDFQTSTLATDTLELTTEQAYIFKPESSSSDIINKNDCLSIKEKLNSKLSQVLNKRKRENNKDDKLIKQKKVSKPVQKESLKVPISKSTDVGCYKNLTVIFEQSLAQIMVKNNYPSLPEVLKELQDALTVIDNRKDVSVTLLMSECGTFCSFVDLQKVLNENMETRTNNAFEIAESIRVIQMTLENHSKLLCGGVWGEVRGVGLALSALCDLLFAADSASFGVSPVGDLLCSSAVALLSRPTPLSGSFVKDLVVLNRCVSAGEALGAGLVSRVWPATPGVHEQMVAFARDIAAKPVQNTLLRKQLLNLNKNEESRAQFLSNLMNERDALAEYWTSIEGQDLIRNYVVA